MTPQTQAFIATAIMAYEKEYPMTKYTFQLGGHRPEAFHAHVAQSLFSQDPYSSTTGGVIYARPDDFTDQQLTECVQQAYQLLDYSPYASLGPGDGNVELIASPDNYNPAPGFYVATLISRLPVQDEPAVSACLVNHNGELVLHPQSKAYEYLASLPADQEQDMFVVHDRHGNCHPVKMSEANREPVLADPTLFTFYQSRATEKLIADYQKVCEAMLQRHYCIELGDTGLAEVETIKNLVQCQLQPYEAINDIADNHCLDRIDDRYSDSVTSDDQRYALHARHEFDSSAEACETIRSRRDVAHGECLHVEGEGVVGLAWTYPIAVTEEAGMFHHLQDQEDLTKTGLSKDQVLYAIDVAKRHNLELADWAEQYAEVVQDNRAQMRMMA